MRPHVMFTDTDGNVHVSPPETIHMDSDHDELSVAVDLSTDFFVYYVTKEEFERLLRVLTTTQAVTT